MALVAPVSALPGPHADLQQHIAQVLSRAHDFSRALQELKYDLVDLKTSMRSTRERRIAGLDITRRHLVINMDVNKTILMRDKATGKNVTDIVNEVLSDSAWGTVQEGRWILCSKEPTARRPEPDESGHTIVSYNEFLSTEFPGAKNKKLRNQYACKFTDEGEPGQEIASYTTWLAENLKDSNGTPVTLIPAFFELLIELKKQNRSFTLCFRTFGDDLPDAVEELNTFCEGNHPNYPGFRMDGSDGSPDYRVKPEDPETCGIFYRDAEHLALAMGTWKSPEREKMPSIHFYDDIPGVVMHKALGDSELYELLRAKCSKPGTLALRDYFPYWKSKEMSAEGGKILYYELAAHSDTHFLFFDDNIRYSNAYIVDARPTRDNGRVPFIASLLQSHICRAEPLESIMSKDYFIKHVARLEDGYERKLKARSRLKRVLRLVKTLRTCFKPVNGGVFIKDYDAWKGLKPKDEDLPACNDDRDPSK
jgi:hypothetical protein